MCKSEEDFILTGCPGQCLEPVFGERVAGFHFRSERRTEEQHGAGDGGQDAGVNGELRPRHCRHCSRVNTVGAGGSITTLCVTGVAADE